MFKTIKKFLIWINKHIPPCDGRPPKWHFWNPLSGAIGGIIFGIVICIFINIILLLGK